MNIYMYNNEQICINQLFISNFMPVICYYSQ